jgi:hypothetical protein
MTLAVDEFIRRFLLHALPDGFHRIRHYGFLANGGRSGHLARCRQLLDAHVTAAAPEPPTIAPRAISRSEPPTSPSVPIAGAPCGVSQPYRAPPTLNRSAATRHDSPADTPAIVVFGPTAADSNACTDTALPINLSNLQCRLFSPRRLTQSRRTALDRQPPMQINHLPLAHAHPAPTSTANETLPLSP